MCSKQIRSQTPRDQCYLEPRVKDRVGDAEGDLGFRGERLSEVNDEVLVATMKGQDLSIVSI